MTMLLLSTRTIADEVGKHVNNAHESAKKERMANEDAKHKYNGK